MPPAGSGTRWPVRNRTGPAPPAGPPPAAPRSSPPPQITAPRAPRRPPPKSRSRSVLTIAANSPYPSARQAGGPPAALPSTQCLLRPYRRLDDGKQLPVQRPMMPLGPPPQSPDHLVRSVLDRQIDRHGFRTRSNSEPSHTAATSPPRQHHPDPPRAPWHPHPRGKPLPYIRAPNAPPAGHKPPRTNPDPGRPPVWTPPPQMPHPMYNPDTPAA